MPRMSWISHLSNSRLWLIALTAVAAGCRDSNRETGRHVHDTPVVRVVKPERRNITYAVVQPGFVEAYERTSIYAKVSGFITHFHVDIGQKVKKDDVLAEIFVPELDEEHQRKAAQVELGKRQVEQAQQFVLVTESNLRAETARLAEAKANIGKYDAEVVRWESEVKRLAQMVAEKVVDNQVLTETQKQLDSSRAARAAAQAAVAAREADRQTAEASLGKAKIDVETQKAEVAVAEADERKAAALLEYRNVTAPYDGIITVRNANTGDYVVAATGDKSTTSPSPMFVVARTDLMRVIVEVPEAYASYVHKGTKAVVRPDKQRGERITGSVARTSWSLNESTRTLRAEIDVASQENDTLRPGAYVYGEIILERPNVFAVPPSALMSSGNETVCFLFRNGRALKTRVDAGISDGTSIEVDRMEIDGNWKSLTGQEEVILGSLNELINGRQVTLAPPESKQPAPKDASPSH